MKFANDCANKHNKSKNLHFLLHEGFTNGNPSPALFQAAKTRKPNKEDYCPV